MQTEPIVSTPPSRRDYPARTATGPKPSSIDSSSVTELMPSPSAMESDRGKTERFVKSFLTKYRAGHSFDLSLVRGKVARSDAPCKREEGVNGRTESEPSRPRSRQSASGNRGGGRAGISPGKIPARGQPRSTRGGAGSHSGESGRGYQSGKRRRPAILRGRLGPDGLLCG